MIPRESGQTSPWSHITKELEKPIQETKQMTEAAATGAVSREPEVWYDIDLRQAYRNVRRLQARIVKATQEGRLRLTPTGRATANALQLNRESLVNLRRILYGMGEHPPAETD